MTNRRQGVCYRQTATMGRAVSYRPQSIDARPPYYYRSIQKNTDPKTFYTHQQPPVAHQQIPAGQGYPCAAQEAHSTRGTAHHQCCSATHCTENDHQHCSVKDTPQTKDEGPHDSHRKHRKSTNPTVPDTHQQAVSG